MVSCILSLKGEPENISSKEYKHSHLFPFLIWITHLLLYNFFKFGVLILDDYHNEGNRVSDF